MFSCVVTSQDEPWSTTGVDVGADTPSPMLAGTKDESDNLRKWLERRNKKRKIVVDQDETTSDECDEPVPYPLPVPLPPTEWPPAGWRDRNRRGTTGASRGDATRRAPYGRGTPAPDGGSGRNGSTPQTPRRRRS